MPWLSEAELKILTELKELLTDDRNVLRRLEQLEVAQRATQDLIVAEFKTVNNKLDELVDDAAAPAPVAFKVTTQVLPPK